MRARALLALSLAGLLALGGCGGGSEEKVQSSAGEAGVASTNSGSTSSPPAKQQGAGGEERQKTTGPEPGEGEGEDDAAPPQRGTATDQDPVKNPPQASRRTPGSKAVAPEVPVIQGGDNSIQAFGAEGEEDQARQAAATLAAYLGARAAADWAGACEEVSAQLKEELAKLVEQAKSKPGAEKPSGCAQALELIAGGQKGNATAPMPQRVLSFRVESPYAYLIFEGTQGAVRAIAMKGDGGTWKVNVPEPTELPKPTAQGSNQ